MWKFFKDKNILVVKLLRKKMVAEQYLSFPGNKKIEIGEWKKVLYDVNNTVLLVHHIAN